MAHTPDHAKECLEWLNRQLADAAAVREKKTATAREYWNGKPPDCQLRTVAVYGLCTCDFDKIKAATSRTAPFPGPAKIITLSNPK